MDKLIKQIVCNTLKVTVEDLDDKFSYIDEESKELIINKLLSPNDEEVDEGINLYNKI